MENVVFDVALPKQNEAQLTPEERDLEIARLQTERAKFEAERAREENEARVKAEEIRQVNARQTLKAAVGRTGVRFYIDDPDEFLTILRVAGFELTPNNSGTAYRVLDEGGKEIELEKAIEYVATTRSHFVHSGGDHLKPRDASGKFE